MKKKKAPYSWPEYHAVREAGAVTLTNADSERKWERYNKLAMDGYLVCYLGAEPGSRVFMLRPAFKGKRP